MIDQFKSAVARMSRKSLVSLRNEYAVFVQKIEPQIAGDRSGYYTLVAEGIRDVETLAAYRLRLSILDETINAAK